MWDPGERSRPRWRRHADEDQSPDDGPAVAAETEPAPGEAGPPDERSPASPAAWEESAASATVLAPEVEAVPPPSLPFEAFVQLLDVMAERGLPTLLHEGSFGDQPGNVSAQFVAALRFLDLIDDQGQPMPRLILLVDDVARRRILQQLLSNHYVRPMRIGLDATPADIEAWFRERGLEGDQLRRGIAFLIGAADYAGMQLPGVTDARSRAGFALVPDETPQGVDGPAQADSAEDLEQFGAARFGVEDRSARWGGPAVEPAGVEHGTPEDTGAPPLPEHILDAKRSAYIDLLMELVKATGDHPDEKLLDRIERVLGYPPEDFDEPPAEPEPEPPPLPRPGSASKRAARAKR